MGRYARLEVFDPGRDDWETYVERLDQAFVVNGVKGESAEERRAALLTICGKKTYDLLKTLCAPDKPAAKTYEELCALLEDHCCPKPLEVTWSGKRSITGTGRRMRR